MGANNRWETIKNEARPYRGLAWWIVLGFIAVLVAYLLVSLWAVW